jgi:hypothetical protein
MKQKKFIKLEKLGIYKPVHALCGGSVLKAV